mmetsp:Transcript_1113/g.2715  ORF Transcript_1113/g.2715 Transcript_1113/m.2715 type:complete len:94 (-) Transcript_1113:239-520(-)
MTGQVLEAMSAVRRNSQSFARQIAPHWTDRKKQIKKMQKLKWYTIDAGHLSPRMGDHSNCTRLRQSPHMCKDLTSGTLSCTYTSSWWIFQSSS